VSDTGDLFQPVVTGPYLQRDSDTDQDDKEAADDIGHHPVTGQSTAHDYYLMS
jgi:hypothetical protein